MRTIGDLGIIIKMDHSCYLNLSRRPMLLLHLEAKSIYVNLWRKNPEQFMQEFIRGNISNMLGASNHEQVTHVLL